MKYYARMGIMGYAPCTIAESAGYATPRSAKAWADRGYPETKFPADVYSAGIWKIPDPYRPHIDHIQTHYRHGAWVKCTSQDNVGL